MSRLDSDLTWLCHDPNVKQILRHGKVDNLVALDVLQNGKTCTIRVKGKLTMGEALDEFEVAVRGAFESGHPLLLLNLEAVPYLDSSAIGAVVHALSEARKLGGDAKLVNPSPFALKMFKMVHILNLFSVYPDEAEALAACEA